MKIYMKQERVHFLTQSFWLLRNPHIAMFFSRRFCFVWNLLKLKVNIFYIFSNWNALWYASDCHMSTCWVSEITSWVCELIYLLNSWDHSLDCEFTCWIHEITSSVCEFTCWVLEITAKFVSLPAEFLRSPAQFVSLPVNWY